MDPLHILLLVGAGIFGGIISSIAGGAALFIFPAVLATGLSPIVATAVCTTALTPGLVLAGLYDRAQLPPLDRSFAGDGRGLGRRRAHRRGAAAAHAGADVRRAGAAAARLCHPAVRLRRPYQRLAA